MMMVARKMTVKARCRKSLAFPTAAVPRFGTGEPVVGQLHHKGDGLAAEGGVVHDEGRHDADEDAEKIKGDHHWGTVLREKCRRKKA